MRSVRLRIIIQMAYTMLLLLRKLYLYDIDGVGKFLFANCITVQLECTLESDICIVIKRHEYI
jgi:hypothetical protein